MAKLEPTTWMSPSGLVQLRTAESTDAARLLALLRQAADESDGLTRGSDEFASTVDEYAAMLSRRAAAPTDVFLVAELAERPLGFAILTGSPLKRFRHEVTLAMVVLREVWGQGFGAALLRELLGWADAQGLVRVALEVAATNERALRLYKAHGFEIEGRLRARRKHGDQFVDNFAMARVAANALALAVDD